MLKELEAHGLIYRRHQAWEDRIRFMFMIYSKQIIQIGYQTNYVRKGEQQ